MVKISPSILASDFSNLGGEARAMEEAGVEMLHIDVMDGHFVPNISFGAPVIRGIRPHFSGCLDVHLMISDPLKYMEDFAAAGANLVTFHLESDSPIATTLQKIKGLGLKAGLSIKPSTPVEELIPWLPQLDLVLVMTVEPGFGGQKFMPDMMKKVEALRLAIGQSGREIDLQVDGGITDATAPICWKSGANVLVAGSYLFSQNKGGPVPDYRQAVQSLIQACRP